MLSTLASAGGYLAAPDRQGGVEAGELHLPLQVVTHVAVKVGSASREQVQHRHLPEVRPLRQWAAQPEDCAQRQKAGTGAGCILGHHVASQSLT